MDNMPDADDPVVSALRRVEKQYQNVVTELRDTAEAERAEAERQRLRVVGLQEAVREIHRALFRGSTYALILQTCLKLTGATRGLYLALESPDAPPCVRAAIGAVDARTSALTPYLKTLCTQTTRSGETLVCNKDGDIDHLPQPADVREKFHNFIAAPIVLMRGLSGVIIAADKKDGDFNEEDVQTLIHIGSHGSAAIENAELRLKLQDAYLATVSVLADAMEAKDPYTRGHCEMVSKFARRIARRLDLDPQEQSVVGYAALLHDIGKIGVSDGILNKPGALLPEERELVRSHVRVGHDLIHNVPALTLVADAVLHHHEWYDGSGYPDGLEGDQIPLASRIVCVVDSYGAMISRRSYKEAFGEDYARAELDRCAGSQFDPRVVAAFHAVLEEPPPEEEEAEALAPLPDFLPDEH